jgi:hypothetical protein
MTEIAIKHNQGRWTRTLIPFTFIVFVTTISPAQDFVFETNFVRLALSPQATVTALVEKTTGKDWLQPSPRPGIAAFALVRLNGHTVAATEMVRVGDRYQVRFGKTGAEADYRIVAGKSHILLELLAVRGAGADDLTFAQVPVRCLAHNSEMLNVKWDNQFTFCLMALDDRCEANLRGGALRCTAHREFGLDNHKAALIAVPTCGFYAAVQELEREFQIPYAVLDGQWAKTSEAVRRGYLFVDLTEKNADEVIRLAKLGGFSTILIYSDTWATSNGSYPMNTANFPGGEASLKAVAGKCHRAGLKVGIHTLTSFVAKSDPLVHPVPDKRLLKDGQAVLAADVGAEVKELAAKAPLESFPGEPTYYGARGGMEVQVDDEIITYRGLSAHSDCLVNCTRGAYGTRAAPHQAGARIEHLAQRYNSFLVDLRTSLKDVVADRIAGVINRCGLDMVYFDGGVMNEANGPSWYWVGIQQAEVFKRVQRELLVQGSGATHWTWHIFCRGVCDDFAALAPKQYLDYHKIADCWAAHRDDFLPAELGWWGFLGATPDHPATMPDEVEHYAVRMLALDAPVSLETGLETLKGNGRTEELLKLLATYERLRLSRSVPAGIREKLRTGEWHRTEGENGRGEFRPVRYDTHRLDGPGSVSVVNPFAPQPLRFRLAAAPSLADVGSPGNLTLLRADPPLVVPLPAGKAKMPGALGYRAIFARAVGDQVSALMVGATDPKAGQLAGKSLDLTQHRALAVSLQVDDTGRAANDLPAVLNVQVESDGKRYRDYYIDLDFTGQRTVVIPEPPAERMLAEFRPDSTNYAFKHAGYIFNYGRIVAINLRWMRLPKGSPVNCRVSRVEALKQSNAVLRNPRLVAGKNVFSIPAELQTGDYVEYWAHGPLRIFDANGVEKQVLAPQDAALPLPSGSTFLRLEGDGCVPVRLTVITLGDAIAYPRAKK